MRGALPAQDKALLLKITKQNPRITEEFRLEGTFKGHLVQPLYNEQ